MPHLRFVSWSLLAGGVLGLLAAAPRVALGGGGAVSLDGFAGYRGYLDETEWGRTEQAVYEQSLQAALDSFIFDRALAGYHLGFALDHRLYESDSRWVDTWGYRYDAELDFWRDGDVPVNLFAHRQTLDAWQADVPIYRVTTNAAGYSAALVSRFVPRVQSTGFFEETWTSDGDTTDYTRSSDVSGDLVHVRKGLVATADFTRRRFSRPGRETSRDYDTASVYGQYRLDPATEVLVRGQSRTFRSTLGDETSRLDMQNSEGLLLWRPRPEVNGNLFYRVNRGAYDGLESGDASAGTDWLWQPRPTTSTALSAGVSDSFEDASGDRRRYLGRYLRGNVIETRGRGSTRVQFFAQAGVAAVDELDTGDGGVQRGVGGGTFLSHGVASNLVHVTAGANAARNWDSSPRQASWRAWGWSSSLDTRQVRGLSMSFRLREHVIEQLVLDEGDSRRFHFQSVARYRLGARVESGYVLTAYRDVLDDEYASGLSHAARLTTRPIRPLNLSVMYFYDVYDHDDLEELWTRRVDVQALYLIPLVNLSLRYTEGWTGGRAADRHFRTLWLEASRRFQWQL